MNKTFHVATTGCDYAAGTKEHPFRTINRAAQIAEAGDTVVVHEGTYREWVKPANSGESDVRRVTYQAADGEKVVIKGSEEIKGWVNVEGTVWKVTLPNRFFGDYNPYQEHLWGDWLVLPEDMWLHPGDVYLNGKSFYEAKTLEDVKKAEKRTTGCSSFRKWTDEKILEPEQTVYQWCCESDKENTTIYANFQGADPNEECVEINVRKCCFYPDKVGVNCITVRGFEMAQAASPWTPPTADQPGLLGAHWSKGWIIENNILHDAKCSGISLGKEASTGHNAFTLGGRKPGYQYQLEAVFRALEIGWSKEKIGSHIVRNNVIYDCGQNGIVGHMGCAFSEIYGNHIYNIAVKHEFFGHEIAGIKFHAAVDTYIHHNRIHNCTLGTWLDWQAQGTRVSSNLYYNNDRDLMIEVTHGPCLMDNNVFGSAYNFDNVAQGTAFVHNLCAGIMRQVPVLDRATPYHFAHSTKVFGYAFVYGGDDRLYNNLFIAPKGYEKTEPIEERGGFIGSGTALYNGRPGSYEAYIAKVREFGSNHDHDLFFKVPQAVYINANAYLDGAEPYEAELEKVVGQAASGFRIADEGDAVYLELTLDESVLNVPTRVMGTETLGSTRLDEGIYDAPDGSAIVLDTDLVGNKRAAVPTVGPLEGLKAGQNRVKVWG